MNYKEILKSRDFQLMLLCAMTLGLLINSFVYMTLPDYNFCMVKSEYETINGSCDFVREELKERRNIINIHKPTPIIEDMDFKPIIKIETITTTTTPTPTTTCPTCHSCPPIPDCVCSCPVCSVCPTCTFEPTPEQNQWMLNYKPRQGSAGYQAGGFDCKDDWLEYLKVPGRPKFKSAPANKFYIELSDVEKKDCLVSFADPECDGEFYINNSIWLISGEGSMKWVHKK